MGTQRHNTISRFGEQPLSESPPRASAQPKEAATGLRILLVDDVAAITRVGRLILQREGFCVDTASEGEEALALVRTHHYAALVSDVNMPGVGGVQFVRALRVREAHLPIIVMSGEGLPREFDGERLDPLHFLAKPFSAEGLIAAVRGALWGPTAYSAH